MGTLFDQVRSEQNLFAAWRHVKRSALNSRNSKIRGQAAEFEHLHQRHLRRIACQLREDRYEFAPVEGVLKDKEKRLKEKKDPRPIAVAPIENRVVQRAILQVLQPRRARDLSDIDTQYEAIQDSRLGKINDINRSKFGVGGLLYPYGGVKPAIALISNAMNNGANYFYQSDIKSFFTKIPTKAVVEFIKKETGDHLLADLFRKGLEINLSNEQELMTYAKLFPQDGIGVAQGSSLSAFAGNVLLFELDHQLNKRGVTAVRYIDDILMVSKSKGELADAQAFAEEKLREFRFSLYRPSPGSDKAAQGKCTDAINFLGCTIQPNRCVPSSTSISKLKNDIASALSSSKEAINKSLNSGKVLEPIMSQSSTLQTISKKIYGWQKSFSFCTDDQPFRQLDEYIARQLNDYDSYIRRKLDGQPLSAKAMVMGVLCTANMPLTRLIQP